MIRTIDIGPWRFQVKMGEEGANDCLATLAHAEKVYREELEERAFNRMERNQFRSVL